MSSVEVDYELGEAISRIIGLVLPFRNELNYKGLSSVENITAFDVQSDFPELNFIKINFSINGQPYLFNIDVYPSTSEFEGGSGRLSIKIGGCVALEGMFSCAYDENYGFTDWALERRVEKFNKNLFDPTFVKCSKSLETTLSNIEKVHSEKSTQSNDGVIDKVFGFINSFKK